MFGLFRRARTRTAVPQRRAALRLEALEWRYQLDATPLAAPALRDAAVKTDVAANAAPQIVDFKAEEIANGLFLITGRVVDESPNGLTVTFGGSTSAAGRTTNATADGTFSTTVQLLTNGTDSGFLTATTVDNGGLKSNEVSEFLDPTPA